MADVNDDITISVKWSGKEFIVSVSRVSTVAHLKRKLQELTQIDPKRQKLLGIKSKDDNDALAPLVKPGVKVMLMGTPDAVIAATHKEAEVAHEVQDDFDMSLEDEQTLEVKDQPEVQQKLARRVRSVQVKVLNEPRPGKKCLVLDIDYTIFDLNSSAERPEELARPYLHEFMTACYEHYDIVIWSATGMKWVEVKMRELGVTTHSDYKISFMLDHAAMLTVNTDKYGVFDCKPLAFIWEKFPGIYHQHNTVMLDDLRRNYVMNRQNGLVIRPYRKAHLTRHTDKELFYLKQYLTLIGTRETLTALDHKRWEDYISGRKALPQ
mmetsp:Transcript_16732/g.28707  ORF Transcript_16732/g.28707 Transcript_16732/m.28707 type:complete len:323 (-) Transcript_16732:615-1583(-)|eukprot:CAMPEP_0119106520 /NCGR_PEP_ID=MMETSP1180-20130426/4505_1 /TAXON_ID=3052 ORGANISM="Chlamydomonas cf sp, Strain CCMP681" /NCGR_SAMPLE_ID=MMETSP1180 /ASSEMBLY_ACC=CAM_ASM_000741 /LENGTH=322 /DNA_ID=CAMNT_0007091877 /DNA_START=140 /DNA_END=1108 /DNA_ORIENTATION=+